MCLVAQETVFCYRERNRKEKLTVAQTLIKEIKKTAYFPKGLFRLKKARGGEVLVYIVSMYC